MTSRKYFYTRVWPPFPITINLSIRTDDGDLSVEVVRVFTPFTFSQVLLVRTDHEALTLQLPSAFLLVLKVYDPRFILKERTSSIHPDLPWTFQAEADAARNRQPLPDFDKGAFPEPPDYEDEDPVAWEEYLHQTADVNFRDEWRAYERLISLQGTGIPRFFGAGRLLLTDIDPNRAISPRALLIEYLHNSKSLHEVDCESITSDFVQSLFNTVRSFAPNGVTHGDLNYGNIMFSFDPPRACIIDFGGAALRWGDSDEEWNETVGSQSDIENLFGKLKGKLKGYDLASLGLNTPPETQYITPKHNTQFITLDT